jgi:Tol biopolymer transport system component
MQPTIPSYDRRIAFIRDAGGTPQLWLMNNDGTGVMQLTFAAYEPREHLPAAGLSLPRWSPPPR